MKYKWFLRKWSDLILLLVCLNLLTACVSSPVGAPTLSAPTVRTPFTPTATPPTPTLTTATPTLTPTSTPAPTATPVPTPVPLTGKLEDIWQTAPDSDVFKRIRYLTGVAVDSKGQLYIVNDLVGQLLKYDSGGNLLADLSRPGQPAIPSKITAESASNRVGHPGAIALDRQDNVYVLDYQSYGVHKFDASGQYLGQFRGVADTGGVGSRVSLTVDESGVIYVLDGTTGQVSKFDNTGKFLGEWGNKPGEFEPEPLDGKLKYPTALAADGQGHIYVADTGNHRIQKFDLNGKFLLKFGRQGQGDGQFSDSLGAMAFDSQGNVYVPDKLNYRVEKFDRQGRFLAKIGSKGSDKGQFNLPVGVAVDRQGQIYVADYLNQRVQKLDAAGRWLAYFGRQGQGDGQLNYPTAVAIDAAGNLYVADTYPFTVQKFDRQGHFLLRWELPTGSDFPDNHLSLTVDPAGNIYLGLSLSQRIFKYDSQGHLLLEWGQEGSGPGQFNTILGLAIDQHNQVWVADAGNYRVQKFDDKGHFLSELDFNFFKDTGQDERFKDAPLAVALDNQDQLYVLFSTFLREFDPQGNFLLKWGDPQSGSGDGTFTLAKNVFVDGEGFVYVHQVGDFHGYGSRFQKFDSQGHLIFSWHSLLHLPMDPYITVVPLGQFLRFDAMTVDRAGSIYLANSLLGRVDKYLQK